MPPPGPRRTNRGPMPLLVVQNQDENIIQRKNVSSKNGILIFFFEIVGRF